MHPACLYIGVIIQAQMPQVFHHDCLVPLLHVLNTQPTLFLWQAHLVPSDLCSLLANSLPDQRNALRMLSTCLITALGSIKISN
jgi:hypothetical protein